MYTISSKNRMVMAPGFIIDGPQDWLNSHHFVGSVSPLRDAVGFLVMLLFEQLSCISLPEQEGLELLPDLLVSPMLA